MNAIVACILAGSAWLLNVIGMSIHYWLYKSVGDKSVSMGLWKVCALGKCYTINNPSSALAATRAFEILAMLAILAAAVLAAWKHRNAEIALLSKVAAAAAVGAGCLMLLGCIIFAAKVKEDESTAVSGLTLHAGFGLCIISAFVAFAAGGVLFRLP